MKQATITLEMFGSGIHLLCDDTEHDEFIPYGDGNKLMEILNEIQDITDPNTVYTLTDKGREVAEALAAGTMTPEEAFGNL